MRSTVAYAFVSLLLLVPARASEVAPMHAYEVETSTGVICNTRKQMERFVALNDADPQSAVHAVNSEEHDPSACAVASLAFVRGGNPLTVRKKDAAFQIVEILAIGVITEQGVRAIAPTLYYALFKIEERMA